MLKGMENNTGYGKRPLWQWIVLYVVIGALVYAAIYFVWYRRSLSSYSTSPTTNYGASAPAVTSMVKVTANGFEPQTITVKVGDKVTWTNASGGQVSINSNDHPTHLLYPPLNLGVVNDSQSVSLVFDKAGSYGYHNHFNPGETGVVVVQ